MTIKAKILEFRQDSFTDKITGKLINFSVLKARSNDIAKGRILTYKVDQQKAGDLTALIDKIADLTFEISAGRDSMASFRVVSVVLSK